MRSLLVERHPGTAVLPKARGINARTMEMYRQCGIDAAIRAAGLSEERRGRLIVWIETLAGREIERRVPGRATPKNTRDPSLRGSRWTRRAALQYGDELLQPKKRRRHGHVN